MWQSIKDFFYSLFGNNDQVFVEDAADLGEEKIISMEEPDEDEMKAREAAVKTRGMRTRGLQTTEIIDLDGDGHTGNQEIATITNPRFLWLLDNGHGSLQAGKRSPKFPDGSQFLEWEFTRDIVKRMAPMLDEAGVQYKILVPEDEVDSFLAERVGRANNASSPLGLKSIFVSIHANAVGMGTWMNGTTGLEVWHYPGSNTGKRIASVFQRALINRLPGWKDRGIRSHQRGSRKVFYVLANTAMPAVLTENGFYTDENETAALMTAETRNLIARAHVDAILEIEQNGYESQEIYRPNMVLA
ncbi:MAG: N-acetylmuramoyl-L-alanine amidase [Bacteroidota bacterium]